MFVKTIKIKKNKNKNKNIVESIGRIIIPLKVD